MIFSKARRRAIAPLPYKGFPLKKAFTLIELIFVIVIIGILSAVAIPKFTHLSSNAKISSEMATAATVQSALDDIHANWITAEGTFSWGNGNTANCNPSGLHPNFNCTSGYPTKLGDCSSNKAFSYLLKNPESVDAKWSCNSNSDYKGPASKADSGVANSNKADKPDSSDHWEYNDVNGTFTLIKE